MGICLNALHLKRVADGPVSREDEPLEVSNAYNLSDHLRNLITWGCFLWSGVMPNSGKRALRAALCEKSSTYLRKMLKVDLQMPEGLAIGYRQMAYGLLQERKRIRISQLHVRIVQG